jgi:hypothetical protein
MERRKFTEMFDLTHAAFGVVISVDNPLDWRPAGELWKILDSLLKEHQKEWWKLKFLEWVGYDEEEIHGELGTINDSRDPLDFLDFIENYFEESPSERSPEQQYHDCLYRINNGLSHFEDY